MAAIPGTILAAKISPGDTAATFATHEDIYGQGGLRTVTTFDDLTGIPLARQKVGMIVYVSNIGTYYSLSSLSYPLTSYTTNFSLGSGGSGGGGGTATGAYLPLSGGDVVGPVTFSGTISGNNLRVSFNDSSALGIYSFAEGAGSIALGDYSHVEGTGNVAIGDRSHVEGAANVTAEKVPYVTYTASTRTFTFTPETSAKFSYVSPGTRLAGFNVSNGTFNFIVASRNSSTGAISATTNAAADGFNGVLYKGNFSSQAHAEGNQTTAAGMASHAEGNATTASGDASHAEGESTIASGYYSHAQGKFTVASGIGSYAEGLSSTARGVLAKAAGYRAEAVQNYTYAWTDGNLGTATANVSTTRTGQYMISASGGVFIPGNVGIGTDNNSNALTVNGEVSATNIVATNVTVTDNISSSVHVTDITTTKTFLSSDTSRIFHFDTTTQPLCAIFPSTLPDGFNVAIMNTGTNNLRLSAAQLNSVGVTIGVRYGGAFIYKDNNQLFAVGRL